MRGFAAKFGSVLAVLLAERCARTWSGNLKPPKPPAVPKEPFALRTGRCLENSTSFKLREGIEQLRQAGLPALRDESFLRDVIRGIGLFRDMRDGGIFGEDNRFMVDPGGKEHYGMAQSPDQLACALVTLSRLNVSTYAEIGTFTGWTTSFVVAYLQRFARRSPADVSLLQSWTTDVRDVRELCAVALLDELGVSFCHRLLDWPPADAPEVIDLCFIDGHHHEDEIKSDINQMHGRCRLLMFHDIMDGRQQGVRRAWRRMRKQHSKVWECTHQPRGVPKPLMGIGIVQLRD